MIGKYMLGLALILTGLISGCNDSDSTLGDVTATARFDQGKTDQSKDVSAHGLITLYTNGDIVTANDHQLTAEAVAVGGGKILAVGMLSEVQTIAGSHVEIKDLGGKALLSPGTIFC